MTILVTGATGLIGREVLDALRAGSTTTALRALTRDPAAARLPDGVTAIAGDLADPVGFEAALDGVDTLFLLVPNIADELTQAMLALDAARRAKVKGIVYLSVFGADDAEYADLPHFASKGTVERMIEAFDLPATILRPAYFIQNDARMRDALTGPGLYPMPIGERGLSMVDTRDIGEAAAAELLRRDTAPGALPRETYALVGPEALTGPTLAALWGEVLGREVRYGGDDLDGFEARLRQTMPNWLARDLRLMCARYQSAGAVAGPQDIARLTALLGHPPRSYRAFAAEMARSWLA